SASKATLGVSRARSAPSRCSSIGGAIFSTRANHSSCSAVGGGCNNPVRVSLMTDDLISWYGLQRYADSPGNSSERRCPAGSYERDKGGPPPGEPAGTAPVCPFYGDD